MGNTEAKEQPLQEPHSIPKSPRVLSSAPEFTAVSPVHTRLDLIHHQSNPSLIQIKGESYNQPPTPSDMSPSARLMPERTQLHIKKPSNLGIKIRNLSPEAIGQGYFSPPKNSPRLQPLSTRNIQSTNSARAKNGQILHGRISGLGGRTGSIEKKNEALYRDQGKFDISKTLEYGDSDQVIFQGTLLKYKPGMHSLWIERWCVVTKKCFKYYKAEWVAKCPDLKPLSTIPIVDIVACRAISLEVQDGPSKKNFLKSDQQSYNELFQFEIFNKNGDFPYQDELGGCQSVQKSDEKDCEGLRLWANYEEKRRSDRHSPLKIKKDQLMRSPVRSRDPRTARNSQGNDIVERDSDRSFSGSPPPIQSTIRESVKLSGKKNGDEENLAIKKSTHKWKKDKSDLISWSGRAREWYFSEKRLLFAVPKAEDRDKWVTVMNQVIHGDSLGER